MEEDSKDFNWEKRSFAFGKLNTHITRMNTQLMPYIVMQFFCALLYFINIKYDCDDKCLYIIIGIIFTLISLFIFIKYNKDIGDYYTNYWEEVRKNELNSINNN